MGCLPLRPWRARARRPSEIGTDRPRLSRVPWPAVQTPHHQTKAGAAVVTRAKAGAAVVARGRIALAAGGRGAEHAPWPVPVCNLRKRRRPQQMWPLPSSPGTGCSRSWTSRLAGAMGRQPRTGPPPLVVSWAESGRRPSPAWWKAESPVGSPGVEVACAKHRPLGLAQLQRELAPPVQDWASPGRRLWARRRRRSRRTGAR